MQQPRTADCPFCDGTGTHPSDPRNRVNCPKCSGVGLVR